MGEAGDEAGDGESVIAAAWEVRVAEEGLLVCGWVHCLPVRLG